MEIDLKSIFTHEEFKKFLNAVNARENYEFRHSKENTHFPHPKTGIYFKIDGRKCVNGVWKDNYLYGFDCWRGNGGVGRGYDPVDKILSYDELINAIYSGLRLSPPRQRQISLFDMEM